MRYTTRIISIPRTTRIPGASLPGGVRRPQVLGPQRSVGFGDRLGLATPGHVRAIARQPGFLPVFAQSSLRESARTGRSLQDVMTGAARGLAAARCRLPWGADADHLKTAAEVENAAAAGFTYFTLDPSEFINDDAHLLSGEGLAQALAGMIADADVPAEWARSYADGPIEVGGAPYVFDPSTLQRAAVKFGRALAHVERLAATVARACADRPFELELAINETRTATTPLEHLYLGLELEARRVRLVSFAPRLRGELEVGIDYRGDLEALAADLRAHAAIAAFCGPYKLSIHGISDKWSLLPTVGQCCGDLLHVKLGEGSYLEALRVVWRANPVLFEQLVRFCQGRFEIDRAAYNISTTAAETLELLDVAPGDEERRYLDERAGRQLLSVTYGSALTVGRDEAGAPFREGLVKTLEANADLYQELIAAHCAKHLELIAQAP